MTEKHSHDKQRAEGAKHFIRSFFHQSAPSSCGSRTHDRHVITSICAVLVVFFCVVEVFNAAEEVTKGALLLAILPGGLTIRRHSNTCKIAVCCCFFDTSSAKHEQKKSWHGKRSGGLQTTAGQFFNCTSTALRGESARQSRDGVGAGVIESSGSAVKPTWTRVKKRNFNRDATHPE